MSSVLQSSGLAPDSDDSDAQEIRSFYENYAKRALQLYEAARKDFSARRYANSASNFTAFAIAAADAAMLQNVNANLRNKLRDAMSDARSKLAESSAKMQKSGDKSATSAEEGVAGDLCSPILPSVTFDELAGMQREKSDIETAFIFPMLYPALFRSLKAALMYGPPGTGKTELAKASVSSLNDSTGSNQKVMFFSADGASLKGKFVGETEKRIRGTFECAADAAGDENLAVIFMDEIDAIGGKRSAGDPNMATSVNALISSIEGAQSAQNFDNVKILSATNLPWRLDAALNRRFAKRIFVDLPNDLARAQIVSNKLQKYFIIDPLVRAWEYELRKTEPDEAVRKVRAQIQAHMSFLGQGVPSEQFVSAKTPEKLREIRNMTRDTFYPKLQLLEGPARLAFVGDQSKQTAATAETRWDLFLQARNPDGSAFNLSDLLFVQIWTGLSTAGARNLATLSKHYQQEAYYVEGGRGPPENYSRTYPEQADAIFAALRERNVKGSPQPALYGYSASDVAKMTDQAINFAALNFARGNVRLPEGDVCSFPNLGVLKRVDNCAGANGACCQLLPNEGESCEVKSLEQRKCIRADRITLQDFFTALGRFASTVNPQEYCETVEYYLSRETIEPGSQQAICPKLQSRNAGQSNSVKGE